MKRSLIFLLTTILLCSFAIADTPATPTDLCVHENVEETITSSYEYTQIPDNPEEHHRKEWQISTKTCMECGATISEKKIIVNEDNRYHSYEGYDGKCIDCGFVPDCGHDAIREELTNIRDVKYAQYTDRAHLYTGYADILHICDYCNLLLKTDYDTAFEYSDDHIYDENLICTICGYKNTCTHDHLIPQYEVTRNVGVEYENETFHKVKQYGVIRNYCFECNYLVSEGEEVYHEELEYHSYDNNSKCYCGHTRKTCEHEQFYYAVSSESYQCTYTGDPDTHLAQYSGYIIKRCMECDKEFEKTPYTEERQSEHWFRNNGMCDCGYINPQPCEHPRIDWDVSLATSYDPEPLNNSHHVVKTLTEYRYMCLDCHKVFSDEVRIEESEEITEHYFTLLGYCDICKIPNPCTHPTTKDTSNIWFYESISSFTSEGHTLHKAIKVYQTICPQCDQTLDVREEFYPGEYFEPHTFENGVCSICGYKEPVTPVTKEKAEVTPLSEYNDAIAQAIQELEIAVNQSTLDTYLPESLSNPIKKVDSLLLHPFVTSFNTSTSYGITTITYKSEQEIEAGKDVIILLGWYHDNQITWHYAKGKTRKDNIVTFDISTKTLNTFKNDPVIISILTTKK